MDTRQIKILLEKYFDGNTTLEEEQRLLGYFTGNIEDPDLMPYRQYFTLLKAGRDPMPVNQEFLVKMETLIDAQKNPESGKIRSLWLTRVAVAATLALMIGISVILLSRNKTAKDTYTDPQLAYSEVQRTLLYVSHSINRGMQPLSAVSKINTGTEHLKTLKKLDTGMEMLNMVSIINNTSNLKK